MGLHVCMGASLACSFGLAPSSLIVLPVNRVLTSSMPAATIMDYVPLVNIPTFGMCMSPTNPAFIAATSAALGTPTPVPCIPVTTTPWTPGSLKVLEGGFPVLNNTSECLCMMGGVITIGSPGQETEMVP